MDRLLRARWQVAGDRQPAGPSAQPSDSEGGADGLADEVRDERGDASQCELPQTATDGRALGEEAHAEAEQEEGAEGERHASHERRHAGPGEGTAAAG